MWSKNSSTRAPPSSGSRASCCAAIRSQALDTQPRLTAQQHPPLNHAKTIPPSCPFSAKVASVSAFHMPLANSVEKERSRLFSPEPASVELRLDPLGQSVAPPERCAIRQPQPQASIHHDTVGERPAETFATSTSTWRESSPSSLTRRQFGSP